MFTLSNEFLMAPTMSSLFPSWMHSSLALLKKCLTTEKTCSMGLF